MVIRWGFGAIGAIGGLAALVLCGGVLAEAQAQSAKQCERVARAIESHKDYPIKSHLKQHRRILWKCALLTHRQRRCWQRVRSWKRLDKACGRAPKFSPPELKGPVHRELSRLYYGVAHYYRRAEALPPSGALNPNTTCCGRPEKCPTPTINYSKSKSSKSKSSKLKRSRSRWSKSPWRELGFRPRKPQRYQFAIDVVQSTQSFTLRAVGAPRCDADKQVWEIKDRVTGKHGVRYTPPQPTLISPVPAYCANLAGFMAKLATRQLPRRKRGLVVAAATKQFMNQCAAYAPSLAQRKCVGRARNTQAADECFYTPQQRAERQSLLAKAKMARKRTARARWRPRSVCKHVARTDGPRGVEKCVKLLRALRRKSRRRYLRWADCALQARTWTRDRCDSLPGDRARHAKAPVWKTASAAKRTAQTVEAFSKRYIAALTNSVRALKSLWASDSDVRSLWACKPELMTRSKTRRDTALGPRLRKHLLFGKVEFGSVRVTGKSRVTKCSGKPYNMATVELTYTTDGKVRKQRLVLMRSNRFVWRLVSFGTK